MSGITLKNTIAADIPTPATDKNTLFFDDSNGEPSYKDDAGAVTSLVGIPGPGVPVGGTTGQVLAKINATDYNTQWTTPAGGGDVVGPASAVDNTLPRFDSTTGKLIQVSGVLVSDADEISGYKGNINRQTGTSYTLVAADSGKIVELANAASIALTADPALPAGFCCTLVQGLAGVFTIASTGSGTVVNRQSQFKSAGANAMCTAYVRSNSGTNAVYVFGGDTAA